MTLRFLADENFDHKTLAGLKRRAPDLDIVAAQEVGLREGEDPQVLEWAAQEERLVVTHDVSTFADFAYERITAGLHMPGVIEIPETVPRSVIIEELILIASASEPHDWDNRVVYLPLR
jgi:predicted nuclease of predicted toxin-antitoxin system